MHKGKGEMSTQGEGKTQKCKKNTDVYLMSAPDGEESQNNH